MINIRMFNGVIYDITCGTTGGTTMDSSAGDTWALYLDNDQDSVQINKDNLDIKQGNLIFDFLPREKTIYAFHKDILKGGCYLTHVQLCLISENVRIAQGQSSLTITYTYFV